jgi:hypothetical protein
MQNAFMDENRARPYRISFRGKLSIRRLLTFCSWFVAEKPDLDGMQLGWRQVGLGEWPRISVKDVRSLPAEVIAALGAIRSCFPSFEGRFPISETPGSLPWERVLNGLPPNGPDWENLPQGGTSLLLREVNLIDEVSLESAVNGLVQDISSAPRNFNQQLLNLREIIRRLLTEALLNVHEHAYAKQQPHKAWVAATVLPRDAVRNVRSNGERVDSIERTWLEGVRQDYVFELAVADIGVGLPKKLAPATMKLSPKLGEVISTLSSGSARFSEVRAEVHADLCDHAFRHYSTSKSEHEFRSDFHRLNWRGLYRCYRQLMELGGFIAISSGQGRAGYAYSADRIGSFKDTLGSKADLPGTLVNFRIPLPAKTRSVSFQKGGTSHGPQLVFGRPPLAWTTFQEPINHNLISPTGIPSVKSEYVALSLPFVELITEMESAEESHIPFLRLRRALEQIDQVTIPIVCFGAARFQDWAEQLRCYVPEASWRSSLDGPPRLVGWLGSEDLVNWTFAGAVPESAEAALKLFEEQGSWRNTQNNQPVVIRFFQELRSHYPDLVRWEKESRVFRLIPFSGLISREQFEPAFNEAFIQYWRQPGVKDEVVTDIERTAIVLPNGKRLKRHLSVFRLLNQSQSVTTATGRLLSYHLKEASTDGKITVVVAQAASRYIAHALLEGCRDDYEVFTVEELLRRSNPNRRIILFLETVFLGETALRVIQDLRGLGFTVVRVIACADLRPVRRELQLEGVPLYGLVHPEFRVEEISDSEGYREFQTDALTNVPIPYSPSKFINLASAVEHQEVLNSNPSLFCIGFHTRGGRFHTFSLPLRNILALQEGKGIVTDWACKMFAQSLETMGFQTGSQEIVIFTLFDSKINSIINHIATTLRQPPYIVDATFLVRMPVAHTGSDAVYPQAESNPLAGCAEVGMETFSFVSKRKPKPGYLALYLSDASVTGNSVREFLYRVASASAPAPRAVVALVVVNRLSPAEVRFFDLCKQIHTSNEKRLPFRYDYLFNLQIRSRALDPPSRHPLLQSIFAEPLFRVGELRDYVEKLQERATRMTPSEGLRHVFCPEGDAYAISTNAVRFRHLLALNEQNEPVVLEIVKHLQALDSPETEDFSVLCILALEPNLLRDRFLRQFGRQTIMDLAARVLSDSNSPLPLKSDALVVLAAFPRMLTEAFGRVSKVILENDVLRRQASLLLLLNEFERGESAVEVFMSCFNRLSSAQRKIAERTSELLKVCSAIQRANRLPDRETRLQKALENLGSKMLHHAAAMENDWDGVATQLSTLENYWSTIASKDRRLAVHANCRRAVRLVEDVILPGFTALSYFARAQSEPALAKDLDDAFLKAQMLLTEFKQLLPSQPDRLAKQDAIALNKAFSALREATWLAPTTDRLLRGDLPDKGSGPLPEAFPKLFASPSNLLCQVAEEVFSQRTAFHALTELTPKRTPPSLTVCRAPVDSLRHIYRLVLGNINRCGELQSIRVSAELAQSAQGKHTWKALISNKVSKGDLHGQGVGLERAEQIGSRFDIAIESLPNESTKSWHTTIIVPGCFQLHQLQ